MEMSPGSRRSCIRHFHRFAHASNVFFSRFLLFFLFHLHLIYAHTVWQVHYWNSNVLQPSVNMEFMFLCECQCVCFLMAVECSVHLIEHTEKLTSMSNKCIFKWLCCLETKRWKLDANGIPLWKLVSDDNNAYAYRWLVVINTWSPCAILHIAYVMNFTWWLCVCSHVHENIRDAPIGGKRKQTSTKRKTRKRKRLNSFITTISTVRIHKLRLTNRSESKV